MGSGFTQVGWVLVSSQYQPQTFTLDPLYVELLLDPTAIPTLLTRPFLQAWPMLHVAMAMAHPDNHTGLPVTPCHCHQE